MKLLDKYLLAGIALAGFLFCILSATGITDPICLTHGCEVYKGYTVAGISFYWIGASVFLILGVMSLWPGKTRLLSIVTGLILVGNYVFLTIQLLLWPCTSCLVVAILLGSFAWCLARHAKLFFRMLCLVWLMLFSANIFLLAKDSIPPWPVLGKNNADIQIFFSPTCPACRQVVENFLQNPNLAPYVAFYPLAKDDNDRQKIEWLVQNLKQGMSPEQAFSAHWQTDIINNGLDKNWDISFNLWRNQLHLAKKGATQVPLIISRMPLGENPDKSPSSSNGCSIFSLDGEDCRDEAPSDTFNAIFK